MAKFNSKQIDPTEYDFTEFPRMPQPGDGDDAPAFCQGKGIIAEPSDEQIDRFQEAARKLSVDEDVAFSQARRESTATLAELNVDPEHLAELPPKYFTRFCLFVLSEFTPGNALGA